MNWSMGDEKTIMDSSGSMKSVVVAVKASKEIPRTAIIWAITHLLQPGDFLELLVVVPPSSVKTMWGFSSLGSNCTIRNRGFLLRTNSERKDHVSDLCSSMVHELSEAYNLSRITMKLSIVTLDSDAVAAEAKRACASWVVLERHLKQEARACMVELRSNVVIVKQDKVKFLRLNLVGQPSMDSKVSGYEEDVIRGPSTTPACSPEQGTFTSTDTVSSSSVTSSDQGTPPPFFYGFSSEKGSLYEAEPGAGFLRILRNKLEDLQLKPSPLLMSASSDVGRGLRDVMSVSRHSTPVPPLCSVCRNKAPEFGRPPRLFPFAELDGATRGFSSSNFLAEGGFGCVHKGTLEDGRLIAVKQHKSASSQGDLEFCSEIEVLSCAQHRNVVTLLGLCLEDGRRMLVYEYICNGSLDSHLYGFGENRLEWSSRQKIGVGIAKGLRYLHEECRVGCIVHRDLRPNNILLTHDFEPLVGDFGLARWQPEGDKGVKTRILGRFGYLAPEYAQSGQITEKADVYSFGVVLLELVTGRKAMDIKRPKGQQCLTEWARPLVERSSLYELVDPYLVDSMNELETQNMLQCAYLCIQRDPYSRPRISQVLRMLEDGTGVGRHCRNTSSTSFGFSKISQRLRATNQK